MPPERAYGGPRSFRQALTDRLKTLAAEGPWGLPELRRQIAYDRLLARLYLVDRGWIVKGATALLARELGVRATIDVDLYRETTIDLAERELRGSAAADLGDWFSFELGPSHPIRDGLPGRPGRDRQESLGRRGRADGGHRLRGKGARPHPPPAVRGPRSRAVVTRLHRGGEALSTRHGWDARGGARDRRSVRRPPPRRQREGPLGSRARRLGSSSRRTTATEQFLRFHDRRLGSGPEKHPEEWCRGVRETIGRVVGPQPTDDAEARPATGLCRAVERVGSDSVAPGRYVGSTRIPRSATSAWRELPACAASAKRPKRKEGRGGSAPGLGGRSGELRSSRNSRGIVESHKRPWKTSLPAARLRMPMTTNRQHPPHPIPYQGSKRRLASAILGMAGTRTFGALYEPFAGSAAVSIAAAQRGLAKQYVIGDSLEPLTDLWKMIVVKPDRLSDEYAMIWDEQLDNGAQHYLEVRDEFNEVGGAARLLYLLARCVKNSPRFNSRGEFNQSPDHRRKGMSPSKMRTQIDGASRLFRERSLVTTGDFVSQLADATPEDLIYLDPPWEGTSTGTDKRYHAGLARGRLIAALEELDQRKIPYLLSYDGRHGTKIYGEALPPAIGATRMELHAGRSSQATLNGRAVATVESLYVSRHLGAVTPPPTQLGLLSEAA